MKNAMILGSIVSGNGTLQVTTMVDGKASSHTVDKAHPCYALLTDALKRKDAEAFLKNVSVIAKVQDTFTKSNLGGRVKMDGTSITLDGKPLVNGLTKRMLDMISNGYDVTSLVRFLENLVQNPSNRAIEELYDFLEHGNMPITEDGCFLAYKSVSANYYSKAAGSLTLLKGKADTYGHIYNGVGEEIECPRNQVDDERVHECSHGLHVGALSYSGPQGWYHGGSDKVVIVKVNPKDAVSVPRDHSAQKLRVCAYTVVANYVEPLSNKVYTSAGNEADSSWGSVEDTGFYEYEHILPNDVISFTYEKDGEENTRYLLVKAVNEDSVHGELVWPEVEAGGVRNFKAEKMSDIKLVTDE